MTLSIVLICFFVVNYSVNKNCKLQCWPLYNVYILYIIMYKNQGRFSKLSPAGVKHPLACDIYLRRSPSYHLICGVYINYLSLEISTLCKELYYDDYSILDLCTLYLYFPWLKETPISIREAAKKVFLLMAWPLRPHHLPPPPRA